MPTPPLDLVEYSGPTPPPNYQGVSISEYALQANKKWLFHTSIGDVILKKVGQLDRDRINAEFFEQRPELIPILQQAVQLQEFAERGVPLNEEHMKKLEDCGRQLQTQQRLLSMACFVVPLPRKAGERRKEKPLFEDDPIDQDPSFTALEKYDAFLTSLRDDEVTRLYMILQELVSSRPASTSCEVMLSLCKEFGIPISEDLTAGNMTAEQADILLKMKLKQGKAMKKAMES